MSFQPRSRLSRKEVFQVVLDASRWNVGFFASPRLPRIPPAVDPLADRLPNRYLLEHVLQECWTRFELRKAAKIGEEEAPGFRLALASGASAKMPPYRSFLQGSQLLVQELLDLLGGQMPRVTVECHLFQLLSVVDVHYVRSPSEVSTFLLLFLPLSASGINVCQKAF